MLPCGIFRVSLTTVFQVLFFRLCGKIFVTFLIAVALLCGTQMAVSV